MHARLSILEDIDPNLEQRASEWVRTSVRLSREFPGYLGMMTLLDRDNRRVVGVSLCGSDEDLKKADEIMNGPPPDSIPEEMKQARPSFVGLFEVIERDGV